MATVVEVLARLRADSSNMVSGLKQAENATSSLNTKGIALGSMLGNLGARVAEIGLTTLKDQIMGVYDASAEWSLLQARTNSVIASTGGVAGISAQGMTDLAHSIQSYSGQTEASVLAGENMMATFTNVRNVVGKGNDIFDQGTKAIANMTAAGLSNTGAVKAVGMALNDPAAGMTRLMRVGVQFTAAQKEQIKTMEASGNLLGAQKVILDQLSVKFGGAAVAAGQTFPMALARAKEAIQDKLRDALNNAMPALTKLADGFTGKVMPALEAAGSKFIEFAKPIVSVAIPAIVQAAKEIYAFAATLIETLAPVIKAIVTDGLVPAWKLTVDVLKVVGAGVSDVTDFIKEHKTLVQALAIAIAAATAAYTAMMIVQKVGLAIKAMTAAVTDGTAALKIMYAWEAMTAALDPFAWVAIAVAALVALGAGLKYAWDHSQTFRDVVIDVANAIIHAFQNMVNFCIQGINLLIKAWNMVPFHKDVKLLSDVELPKLAASYNKVADAAGAAGVAMGRVHGTQIGSNAPQVPVIKAADISSSTATTKAAAAHALAVLKQAAVDQQKVLSDFAAYFKGQFISDITDGTTSGASIVSTLLGNVGSAIKGFAATISDQAKSDSFTLAATKISNALEVKLNGMGASLDVVNKQRADLQTKIDDAQKALDAAISTRQSAMDSISSLLSQPLGSPSELQKALSESSATADSIISQYKSLVQVVQDRFSGVTGSQKDTLLAYLKDQSTQLLALVAKRDDIVTKLADAQKALDTLLSAKDSYASNLAKTLTDANLAMSMFVTDEGLVSTPQAMIESFQARLDTIKKFQSDVQALAARGVSQSIIDQITGMGSGNGDALASSLLTGSDAQIAALNSAASGIADTATSLGTNLSNTFYDQSIAEAQATVQGWQDQQAAINAQMTSISNGIAAQMQPLTSAMANLGTDSAKALLDSLNAQMPLLVQKAKDIGSAMAQAVTDALTKLNLATGTNAFGSVITTGKSTSAQLLVPTPPPGGTGKSSGLTVTGGISTPIQVTVQGSPDPTVMYNEIATQTAAAAQAAIQKALSDAAKAATRVRDW